MEDDIGNDPKAAFARVYKKALAMGLTDKDLLKLESMEYIISSNNTKTSSLWFGTLKVFGLICLLLISGIFFMDAPISKKTALEHFWFRDGAFAEDERCLVEMQEIRWDLFRQPSSCDVCRNLDEVDRVANITPEEFEAKYAYSGRPVVITDGAKNWTAPKIFSFKYFKELYPPGSPVLQSSKESCQFFPYKTNFRSLAEVFEMSEERANLREGQKPWYIGWSNCDPTVAAELRTHYDRPYFLPASSEGMRTDWIFMGSPGYGAHIHVDNVNNPSWQAQLTGRKVWTLKPPLECSLECPNELKVTINQGEIIVLDTNIWYHGTKVISDDISITIGSEYD